MKEATETIAAQVFFHNQGCTRYMDTFSFYNVDNAYNA